MSAARGVPRQRTRPPGVLLDHFRRTIVGYTGAGHAMGIGLRLVLQARPLPVPASSACRGLHAYRHTCSSTHVFASGFLHPVLTARDSAIDYPSPPSGWVWTSRERSAILSRASPISGRANPAHNQTLHMDLVRLAPNQASELSVRTEIHRTNLTTKHTKSTKKD